MAVREEHQSYLLELRSATNTTRNKTNEAYGITISVNAGLPEVTKKDENYTQKYTVGSSTEVLSI